MIHSPGFLKFVEEFRPQIKEITIDEARAHLDQNPHTVLIDVREDHEWEAGHTSKAVHLSRGIFERDVERLFPDPNTELILYCGSGYRSVLTAVSAQKMGYTNVYSLAGGYKAMVDADWVMAR